MNILCTGSAGFIGSHLVDQLCALKHNVFVVDNLATGNRSFVHPEAIFVPLDIRDYENMRQLFYHHHFDFVFHLAAMAKISWCTDHPSESNEVNVGGTINILKLAKRYKVKGVIYSSSSSVYGEVEKNFPIVEIDPINPISAYALQKFAAERYTMLSGVPAVCLRYFNVYGTYRQRPNGAYPNVFSAFMRDSKKKEKLTIYGTGKQRRDFVHVYDVVQANLHAMKVLNNGYLGKSDVFNVGTGDSTSINQIAKLFNTPIEYKEARVGDPFYSCANADKALLGLGFKAEISIQKGMSILQESYAKGGYHGLET